MSRDILKEVAKSRLIARILRQHTPMDSYACQRCGRADGLDAVIPNGYWASITAGDMGPSGEVVGGEWNILCLWCIDELCHRYDIRCSASLHFAGRAVHGTSDSDANREHVSRLVGRIAELESEIQRLRSGTR